jgi:hypothetical protein
LAENSLIDHFLNVPIRHWLVHRESARTIWNGLRSRRPAPVGSFPYGTLQLVDSVLKFSSTG